MTTSKPSIKMSLLFALGVFFLAFWPSASSYAYDYQPTEIAPAAGYERSRALGINNAGEVVGRFYNFNAGTDEAVDRQAFIWDRTRGARLLSTLSGESSAWGINNNGLVSGYAYTSEGNQHAVLWISSENSIMDIGTLTNTTTGSSGPTSTAYDLNDLGQLAGNADIPNDAGTFTPFHAFLYDQTSGIQDLGTFTTSSPEWQNGYSIAYSINNNGEAVGIAHDSSWAFLPFVYDGINGMQQLPRDPAYTEPDDEWYAVAINDDGLIGGHVIAATNQSLPFYWPNKSSAPVKITMPAGFPYGEIYGINAQGEMVGIMWDSDQTGATEHAFIFDTTNGVRDLNALIDPSSGWVLNFARDINDKGQVVGYGEKNGLKRGFFMDPKALATVKNELVCDFGSTYGLWRYGQGYGWNRLNTEDPGLMVPVDLNNDGLDELVVSFTGYGLYTYNPSTSAWLKINTSIPETVIRLGNGIVCDFGAAYGLWYWDQAGGWKRWNASAPTQLLAADFNGDGLDELMATFTGYGLYTYNPSTSTWVRINASIPESMIRLGNGIVCDFGAAYGLWYWDQAGGWKRWNASAPTQLLAADFNGDGLDELMATFTGYGLYTYNPSTSTWVRINASIPESMIRLGNGIVCDFGAAYGLWYWDQVGGWKRWNASDPDKLLAIDLNNDGKEDLIASFAAYGLYNYDPATGGWIRINASLPDSMKGVNFSQ